SACCVWRYRTWRAQSALDRLTRICSREASLFLLTAGRRCLPLSDSCCHFLFRKPALCHHQRSRTRPRLFIIIWLSRVRRSD
ncbi:hypothetical protein ATANTOWER_016809, partial [Ataeniobius toweri]|nr:hypothetical protein [Ataeniobius toweri]